MPVKVQSSDQPQDSVSVPAAGAHATQYLSSCDSYHGLTSNMVNTSTVDGSLSDHWGSSPASLRRREF